MNNRSTRTAAVCAFTAAMLLLPFVANATEQTPAAEPKPAIETWTAYEGFAAHPKLQHIVVAT